MRVAGVADWFRLSVIKMHHKGTKKHQFMTKIGVYPP